MLALAESDDRTALFVSHIMELTFGFFVVKAKIQVIMKSNIDTAYSTGCLL